MPETSTAYFILSLFGAAWAGLYWFSTDILAQYLGERQVKRLWNNELHANALKKADQIIAAQDKSPIFSSWILALLPVAIVLAIILPLQAMLYVSAGLGVGLLALIGFNGKSYLRNFRSGVARRIRRFFLKKGDRDAIDHFLSSTYQQNLPEVRKVAIDGMGSWGSPVAVRLLEEASRESDPHISQSAAEHLRAVQLRLVQARPMRVQVLPDIFAEYERLTVDAEEQAAHYDRVQKILHQRSLVVRQIESIIDSQMHLRNVSPDLFCQECLTRSEELVHRDWRYVRCKMCREPLNLQRGVREVVGTIGPGTEPELKTDILYLPLWLAHKETARPAEVDRIEVQPGGQFKYDWAITAVVEAMGNRFPELHNKIEITIDPSISLQTNTIKIVGESMPIRYNR